MSLIIRLPNVLAGEILSFWILIEDVIALDYAFCNRLYRSAFLDLVRSDQVLLNDDCNDDLAWAVNRRVNVTEICIYNEDDCELVMELNLSTVLCLSFFCDFDNNEDSPSYNSMVDIVNRCISLESLTIDKMVISEEDFEKLNISILSQLTEFNFSYCKADIFSEIMPLIAIHCRNLTQLEIACDFTCESRKYEEIIKQIISNNSKTLETITLSPDESEGSFEISQTIILGLSENNCFCLAVVIIYNIDKVVLLDICSLLENCPNLVNLQLCYEKRSNHFTQSADLLMNLHYQIVDIDDNTSLVLSDEKNNYTAADMCALITRIKSLCSIDFKHIHSLNNDVLATIATNHQHTLTNVAIENCYDRCTADGVLALFTKCTSITTLTLQNFPNQDIGCAALLEALPAFMPNITNLSVTYSFQCTPETVMLLVGRFPNLLAIRVVSIFRYIANVDHTIKATVLMRLSESMPALRVVWN